MVQDETQDAHPSNDSVADSIGLPVNPPGYELREELGRGGMGIVYRAHELSLDRDVAIKMLAHRYATEAIPVQRFLSEARITGQLQHPGIPAVHQVGILSGGRPYLAMKLIKGNTLETILKQQTDRAAERGRMLAVFEAVCQAIGYAHSHRVIHRDLKPANVMVGAFGEVQVMDWGLAKVLGLDTPVEVIQADAEETRALTEVNATPESSSQTQAGSMVGTPSFISPEQAGGEIDRVDERSDVFGLGALLASMLTGKPPYLGATLDAVRLKAVRGNLDDCFKRLNACGAEPELIALCRRCLSFDPTDRPRDAGEVAVAVAELRSAAEERARIAERQQAATDARAEEQHYRRKWQFAALGVLVLALLGGIFSLGFYLRAQSRANDVLAAKNVQLAEAAESERQRFGLAVDAIGLLTGNISQNVLLQQREFDGLRARLLTGAADFYSKLEVQLKDRNDPASRAALARAYFELGDLIDKIDSKADALAAHQKALAIRHQLAQFPDADVEASLDLARSQGRVARLLDHMGDPAGGLKAFETQRDIAKQLEKTTPSEAVLTTLAQGYAGVGSMLHKTGKLADAEVSNEKARAIQQRLVDEHPEVVNYQRDLAKMLLFTSEELSSIGKLAEAQALYKKAVAIQKKLADDHPSNAEYRFELALSYHANSWEQYQLGKTAEALASARAANAILQKLVESYPAVTEFAYKLAQSNNQIGEVLYTSKKLVEGLAFIEAANKTLKKLADDHPKVAQYRADLLYSNLIAADTHYYLGQLDRARTRCLAVVAQAEVMARDQPTLVANRSILAWSLRILGMIHLAQGDVALAAGDIRKALAVFAAMPRESGEMLFEAACAHATLSILAGQAGSGIPASDREPEAQKALSLLEKSSDFGYRSERFQQDKALDPLRSREEFRKLLAEITALARSDATNQKSR
jgi:tRNA A-37 threonylcarbamoyl transferase component Bud32/tetratricopeptide (TPR) repeat protein